MRGPAWENPLKQARLRPADGLWSVATNWVNDANPNEKRPTSLTFRMPDHGATVEMTQ